MGVIYRNGIPYGGSGASIQVDALPAAEVDLLETIYQYVGITDANYTNGYFYECVEVTPPTDPKTYKWKQKNVQSGGGGTGGNADFDVSILPLGPTGMYEVRSQVYNEDNENSSVVYSRGANGELPQWFSMNVNSILGGDTFQVATKDYADGLMSGKVDFVVLDVANFNMTIAQFVELFFSDKLIFIKDGNLNHLVADKYTWDMLPEVVYELSYFEGDVKVTYTFEITDDVYYRGVSKKPLGYNLEVGVEKRCGTYREGGVSYPVYNKIIKIDALPSTAGTTTYPHGIANIKQILQVYGFTTDGFVLNAPRQNAQDNIAIYQMSKSASNQTLSIEVGKDRSNKAAYVCMVYAKNN